MYSFSDDSRSAREHLGRWISIIEHLEEQANYEWILRPPAASSEITAIDTDFPEAPVCLEDSLRSAGIAALECASHLRIAIQSRLFAPSPFRTELRTILMGAGRLGYISMPTQPDDRREHAEHILRKEAHSLDRALKDIDRIEHLPGLRWADADVDELRRKIKTITMTVVPGDGLMIRKAADLIGREAALADPTIESGVLRDHLMWIWHTTSGSAHGLSWQERAHGDFVTDLGAVLSAFHYALVMTRKIWAPPANS